MSLLDYIWLIINEIKRNGVDIFPRRVSYGGLLELRKEAMLPLGMLLKARLLGKCTGISFADITH